MMEPMEPMELYAHVPPLLRGYGQLEQATAKLHRVDERLMNRALPRHHRSRAPPTVRAPRAGRHRALDRYAGVLELGPDDAQTHLAAGQTRTFSGDVPHRYRACEGVDVEATLVVRSPRAPTRTSGAPTATAAEIDRGRAIRRPKAFRASTHTPLSCVAVRLGT